MAHGTGRDAGGASQGETKALSWAMLLSTYVPAMVLSFGHGIATPAIPVLARSYDIPFGVASLVIVVFLAGGMAASIPTGYLIDRVGRRKVILAGPIITAIVSFMVAMAGSFPELLVLRFIDGWAAQMWTMGRVAAIADSSNVKQRGRQVNWMFGADHIGSLTGPLLGGVVADMAGIRAPFVLYGILAFIAVVPSFWLVKETRPGGAVATARIAQPTGVSGRWKANLHLLVLPFLILFAVDFLVAISRGPLYAGMFHLYAAYEYQLSPTMIGVIATAASALGLPISFTAGWVMDRYGRKATMVPGFTSLGIALLTVAATAYFHLPLEWYLAAFFFVAGAQAMTGGSVQTLGADVAPPEARGKFLGLWRLVAQVGTVVSPTVFGYLADNVGYHASFVFLSSGTLIASFLLITRVRETLHQEPAKPLPTQPDKETREPALVS